ncbi:Transcription factor BIM2 [Linum perenne]
MTKSVKSHAEEEDDADDYDSPSSRGEVMKTDTKTSDQKGNAYRSKHSETEQRRRCKINERFQILRELIPQNDQKRDKASLLLEVIGYIQFLQERLQVYEGSYHGWTQELTKLVPWKNHANSENLVDNSQILKNGSAHDGGAGLANVRRSVDSDLEASTVCKELDHALGILPSVQYSMQSSSSMIGAIERASSLSTKGLQGSVSDAVNMAHQFHPELCQSQPCGTAWTAPSSVASAQELTRGHGSASISNAYSQGVLSSLAQALESSGVDLSETSISVKIDVDKSAKHGATALPLDQDDQTQTHHLNNQVMERTGFGSGAEQYDQHTCKRLRTEKL